MPSVGNIHTVLPPLVGEVAACGGDGKRRCAIRGRDRRLRISGDRWRDSYVRRVQNQLDTINTGAAVVPACSAFYCQCDRPACIGANVVETDEVSDRWIIGKSADTSIKSGRWLVFI